jgi:hypothetical protein
LTAVLEGVAFVFPDLGYCQGMDYIALALVSHLQDTETSISVLIGMIYSKKLKGLLTRSKPEYHLQSFVL